jgi:hypothetical protein
MTKLVEGKIAVGTACPFRSECRYAQDMSCNHEGLEHNVAYSCALARLFDIIGKTK